MKRNTRIILKEGYDREWQKQFISPIPPHLTPEEQEMWEREMRWQKQEYERRQKEGYYPNQGDWPY